MQSRSDHPYLRSRNRSAPGPRTVPGRANAPARIPNPARIPSPARNPNPDRTPRPAGAPILIALTALFSTLAAPALVAPASAAIREPFYGADDRKELGEVSDRKLRDLADSVVAIIDEERLVATPDGARYRIQAPTLAEAAQLCRRERFGDQTSLAQCSGALVGPELVLTAGHCVSVLNECKGTRIAFGYAIRRGAKAPTRLDAREVYSCKEIVYYGEGLGRSDLAVLRLDRPVPNHRPLGISRGAPAAPGTPLVAMGYPNGVPLKIAAKGRIRERRNDFQFLSNVDTFEANSGSPLFNARTGLIEGVLSEGDSDYEYSEEQACFAAKRCTESGCRGEVATFVSYAAGSIPAIER